MNKPARVAAVTGGLMVTGAVCGATAGIAALAVSGLLEVGLQAFSSAGPFLLAAMFGGVGGAVAAPLVAWSLLRRVPLGRAIGWPTMGTSLGAAVGWLASSPRSQPTNALAGAVVGLVATALCLWYLHRRSGPTELS